MAAARNAGVATPAAEGNGPESPLSAAPGAGRDQPLVIGRRQNHRLDLRLAFGDVVDVPGRALLLGVYPDVRPTGAASRLDQRLGGLISDVMDRRMFSARLGEVFVLPAPRRGIDAELVVLAGLGEFASLGETALQFAVENAVRTLLSCRIDDMVTVSIGGNSSVETEVAIRALLRGLIAALRDHGPQPSLRSVSIAEIEPDRFARLRSRTIELAASSDLADLDLTLYVDSLRRRAAAAAVLPPDPELPRTYLIVRETPGSARGPDHRGKVHLDYSLLSPRKKAMVLAGEVAVSRADFDQQIGLLAEVTSSRTISAAVARKRLDQIGRELGALLIPGEIAKAMKELQPPSLTIINDLWSSVVPWELVRIGNWNAAVDGNICRRYATSGISAAKWLQSRREDETLRFLLVVNPTGDLDGADREGDRIAQLVASCQHMRLRRLDRAEATIEAVSAELGSGRYDVVHFAGHAFFDPENRSASGIECAGGRVLSGRDLAAFTSLPTLAVFNACESAMMSRRRGSRTAASLVRQMRQRLETSVSFAEAFLRGGVGSFIGTWWPVRDASAELFASEFYRALLDQGPQASPGANTIGAALLKARRSLGSSGSIDWADYIHYGEPDFRLKTGDSA